MTDMTARHSTGQSLLDIVERASLFALLQQALEHQKLPPEVPRRLYDDLGIPPSQRPDFDTRFR
ncbi:hypothetical protein [Devosia sp. SL43]|jgi:hypothetical protein|uniref:hypothetical protein n=1 Tax=Devosia sp. SL43 TaxID=2806348 RepID=UPI001F18FB20|nr:hypothetical protein [Devosia sp. SL43]UJW84167.1 hypothetical protein IM737_12035 [Devosia sp. SL43]